MLMCFYFLRDVVAFANLIAQLIILHLFWDNLAQGGRGKAWLVNWWLAEGLDLLPWLREESSPQMATVANRYLNLLLLLLLLCLMLFSSSHPPVNQGVLDIQRALNAGKSLKSHPCHVPQCDSLQLCIWPASYLLGGSLSQQGGGPATCASAVSG